MTAQPQEAVSPAWYHASRSKFLTESAGHVADQLAGRAALESLQIEEAQAQEWHESVSALQRSLGQRVAALQHALEQPDCESIHDVILEFDFRRRGLRIDCVLLGEGVLFVVEFKRSRFTRADRDQVMAYAANLLEFHGVTQTWCDTGEAIIVPILSLTTSGTGIEPTWPGMGGRSWERIATRALECDATSLKSALTLGIRNRRSNSLVSRGSWLQSPFRPSSSIIDATLSLYGNHDVAAIEEHSAPADEIKSTTLEVRTVIDQALDAHEYHVVFVSGAPGAGKTLVGLDLAMRGIHAGNAVFLTGNVPLVEVLHKALQASYRTQARSKDVWVRTGYRRTDAAIVASAATYNIVKAHSFLGRRGRPHKQEDGRVLIFDEAQRTYASGRMVAGEKLQDHEADLILKVQRDAYPTGGAVIVALIGHNQAINRGERGLIAWLEAAERNEWSFSIGDETLQVEDVGDVEYWATHHGRRTLHHGHLRQSMRYYRNASVAEWVSAVLADKHDQATAIATRMEAKGDVVWITRELGAAREWARRRTLGTERAGLVASGQARRLAAEGLFVDFKPDIATWMLAPTTDVRSSNALEVVQNQYQVQGLELDYTIACWDADLRREGSGWKAYKMSGTEWQRDQLLDVAKNGYRVILTRARKGMIIFVPRGDATGADTTRKPSHYDDVAEHLIRSGAKRLNELTIAGLS